MDRLFIPLVMLVVAGGSGIARAAEWPVKSAEEIAKAAATATPGDVLVMADGPWNDQRIVFRASGTAEKPITLRARTPGKVVLAGESSLVIEGQYGVVSGLYFKDGKGATDGIRVNGSHCRLTETAVVDGTYKFFVHLAGEQNRLDHCYVAGKTSESPTLQIEAERPNHHQVDHNHFGPRPPLGKNGGETIRVGYSQQSMNSSATVVEDNLFDRCDGEIEIISSKSCDNVYRRNTFLDCAGMMTLRHGNRCVVAENIFIAHHKKGSGGIRVIGEGHRVVNNYIEGVDKGGVWVTSGIPDSPLNGYFRAKDCRIESNTIVDSKGPCIELDAGFGTSKRSLRPENIRVADNVLVVGEGGSLLKGTEGEGFKWEGNVAWSPQGAEVLKERDGIRVADPKLARAADGLLRPGKDSPIRLPEAAKSMAPLTAKEVGPGWLSR